MEVTLWDLLRACVSSLCLVLMAIAAGLAFRRYRRWSLVVLFLATLLMLIDVVVGTVAFSLGLYPGDWLAVHINKLVWVFAIVGGAGEVLRLTRSSEPRASGTSPPSDPQVRSL